jgi:hypothetical protein
VGLFGPFQRPRTGIWSGRVRAGALVRCARARGPRDRRRVLRPREPARARRSTCGVRWDTGGRPSRDAEDREQRDAGRDRPWRRSRRRSTDERRYLLGLRSVVLRLRRRIRPDACAIRASPERPPWLEAPSTSSAATRARARRACRRAPSGGRDRRASAKTAFARAGSSASPIRTSSRCVACRYCA